MTCRTCSNASTGKLVNSSHSTGSSAAGGSTSLTSTTLTVTGGNLRSSATAVAGSRALANRDLSLRAIHVVVFGREFHKPPLLFSTNLNRVAEQYGLLENILAQKFLGGFLAISGQQSPRF